MDTLDAQRYLSDESTGRAEDLSRRLSKFYKRNLEKTSPDLNAYQTLAESEQHINDHFAKVFAPTLESLRQLGYPGMTNPQMVIRTDLKADRLLNGSAQVHYALSGPYDTQQPTLPDKYNGLGFKNLIYMAVEILDFHNDWIEQSEPPPAVHVVMIEEPESHMHAQLQQVFVRQLRGMIKDHPSHLSTQYVITTHSSHIAYEDFRAIRYFQRFQTSENLHFTEVKNLSTFYNGEEPATRDFLLQYLKLTHCDLFFADAAILVEGNVERLLLPLMINKCNIGLESSRLTILEVGGAFAHKFRGLIEFLGLTCLIITDLDSVALPPIEASAMNDEPKPKKRQPQASHTNASNATTSNETLKKWVPAKTSVEELLSLSPDLKVCRAVDLKSASVRVAYQTRVTFSWCDKKTERAGRTFEDAFAIENLQWTQDPKNSALGLRVTPSLDDPDGIADAFLEIVRNLDKTRFALALICADREGWRTPTYIAEGLEWLADQLSVASQPNPSPVKGDDDES